MNAADHELLRTFEDCSLTQFRHQDHIHVAWCYLQKYPTNEALTKMREGLQRFAQAKGKTTLYHETITIAYTMLIAERIARSPGSDDWETFFEQNPELFKWKPSILDEFYDFDLAYSAEAKANFIWPTLKMSDSEFIAAFEDCTLSRLYWSHRAHIRMAWILLSRYPFPEALKRACEGIRRYNVSIGSKGYRETETQFFMRLLAHKLNQGARGLVFDEFCAKNTDLFDGKNPPRKKHYSDTLWRSPESASTFLKPDLAPLPEV